MERAIGNGFVRVNLFHETVDDVIYNQTDVAANVTWLDSEITENEAEPSVKGEVFPRMPRWRSSTLLTYRPSETWDASLGLRFASNSFDRLGNRDDHHEVFGAQDGYRFVDLKGNYHFNDTWKLTAGVDILLDPSRGTLFALLVEAPDTMERLHQGGGIGYAIVLLGLCGLLLGGVKLLHLSVMGRRMHRQLRCPDLPLSDNPLGRLLAVAARHGQHRLENLEPLIDEAVLGEIPRLTRGERLLKLVAAVAPLLGLLGTVVGMIATFQSISLLGAGDPKLMASGISQALVTTALGLITAVPLLFLHVH